MTVALWPMIASQRRRISVFSLSRWVWAKSGVVNDLIMPVYRAARPSRQALFDAGLRPAGGGRAGGILGPHMLGVASAHIRPHIGP